MTSNAIIKGAALSTKNKVLIMVHGRGAEPGDILSIANYLNVAGFTLIAPRAPHNTWYPHSFLAPVQNNEPSLSAALTTLDKLVKELKDEKIPTENIFFLGFSQGACLVAEFTSRNAARYGGIVVFTGGLIGDRIYPENYKGDFGGTPVFIGTSNPDVHVPLTRVEDTVQIMQQMGANVTLNVYENMPHTISQDEVDRANELIFKK